MKDVSHHKAVRSWELKSTVCGVGVSTVGFRRWCCFRSWQIYTIFRVITSTFVILTIVNTGTGITYDLQILGKIYRYEETELKY